MARGLLCARHIKKSSRLTFICREPDIERMMTTSPPSSRQPSVTERHSAPAFARRAMCSKCKPIDERIDRYRTLGSRVTDLQALDGIKRLIAELEAQKLALHPKQ